MRPTVCAVPDGELAIGGIDALHHVKILHHLFLDAVIILVHLVLVVRQLDKQQWVDVYTYLMVSLSQLLALLQGKMHQVLVERTIRVVKLQSWIQYHALFDHPLIDYHLSWHGHQGILSGGNRRGSIVFSTLFIWHQFLLHGYPSLPPKR